MLGLVDRVVVGLVAELEAESEGFGLEGGFEQGPWAGYQAQKAGTVLAGDPGPGSDSVGDKKAKERGREKSWTAVGKELEAGVGSGHMPVGIEVIVVVVVAAAERVRHQGCTEQFGGKAQEGVVDVVVEIVAEREERRWQRA